MGVGAGVDVGDDIGTCISYGGTEMESPANPGNAFRLVESSDDFWMSFVVDRRLAWESSISETQAIFHQQNLSDAAPPESIHLHSSHPPSTPSPPPCSSHGASTIATSSM